ncbi:MAG: phosphoribosylglycinamide formyltransferase [Provencibacterium sp.]|jgi:phosphoribosylglycinamide formyltransferase-1|nr:phosphoribosylglycinamide formyltransferase [Provencibacterium sp.]
MPEAFHRRKKGWGKLKVAVLVSGGGTNLQALIDAAAAGKMPHVQLSLVVASRPGVYALERAERAGIPSEVIARKNFPSKEAYSRALLERLRGQGIEAVVLAGFLSVLSAEFCAAYADRILNVHPSLIPAFCGDGYYGLRVHEEALRYGVKVTGATVHLVNEITDGGRILLQKAVEVREGDTPETLQRRVMEEAEWVLLPEALEKICREM